MSPREGKMQKRRKYSAVSCFAWVLEKQWRLDKPFLFFVLAGVPLTVVSPLVQSYFSKELIDRIGAGAAFAELAAVAAFFLGISFLLQQSQFFLDRKCRGRRYYLTSVYQTEMDAWEEYWMDYENTEKQDFREISGYAWSDANGGNCSMEFFWEEMSQGLIHLTGFVTYASLIMALNPIIFAAVALTSVCTYFTTRWQPEYYEKNKHRWEKDIRRKDYLQGLSEDFQSAKDIKLYGLEGWLERLMQDYQAGIRMWNERCRLRGFWASLLSGGMSIRSNVAGSGNWNKIGDLMLEENRLGQGYNLNGMDCRIYRQQPIITELYEKLNRKHLRLFSEAAMKDFSLLFPAELVSTLAEICIYLVVCFYCTLGAFPVGSVIKYVGYMGRVVRNLVRLFFHMGSMKGNERFLKTYLEYFDIPNDMYQGSLAVEKRSDKKYDVEFRNVSFQYAGSDAYALQNISLKLKVGEKLAVVGRNGSGKTTFIKLLCRLYDPTEGEILMNDFNIRKYDYRQYLDIFSVVFQDYHLLAMPLGNNVSCEASWDEEKAERLLREVGFGERYAQMPKKLETPLYKNFDEDGVIVSGGEAQKIALARALYRDASFIILDEPTAALDPVAEAEIYSKFDEIVGDKTAIYISHRLSSCRFCDKIAVFDKGRIVQLGTHEELLADETGTYYELWHAQAKYYA